MKKHEEEENLKRIKITILNLLPLFLTPLPLFIFRGVNQILGFSLAAFLAGFSGVVTVIRKEIPMTVRSVTGRSAVIQGVIFTIINWLFAIYFAIEALK